MWLRHSSTHILANITHCGSVQDTRAHAKKGLILTHPCVHLFFRTHMCFWTSWSFWTHATWSCSPPAAYSSVSFSMSPNGLSKGPRRLSGTAGLCHPPNLWGRQGQDHSCSNSFKAHIISFWKADLWVISHITTSFFVWWQNKQKDCIIPLWSNWGRNQPFHESSCWGRKRGFNFYVKHKRLFLKDTEHRLWTPDTKQDQVLGQTATAENALFTKAWCVYLRVIYT